MWLLGTLGDSSLENVLTGKGTIRADEDTTRTGRDLYTTSSFSLF